MEKPTLLSDSSVVNILNKNLIKWWGSEYLEKRYLKMFIIYNHEQFLGIIKLFHMGLSMEELCAKLEQKVNTGHSIKRNLIQSYISPSTINEINLIREQYNNISPKSIGDDMYEFLGDMVLITEKVVELAKWAATRHKLNNFYSDIYDTINSIEDEIEIIIDRMISSVLSISLNDKETPTLIVDLETSTEAAEPEPDQVDDKAKEKGLLEFIKRNKEKKAQVKLKIRHFVDKLNVAKMSFYKKHLGKIDHLFDNYGSEATITENVMIDDPVKILFEKCVPYYLGLSKSIEKIFKEYTDLSKKLLKDGELDADEKVIKDYLKNTPVPTKFTFGTISKAIKHEVRYRIGEALLKDNKVYGYTPESIAVKKFPPMHHLLVSLFVENPQEKPEELKVSDVFKSPKSFEIMSKQMKNMVVSDTSKLHDAFSNAIKSSEIKKYLDEMNEGKLTDKMSGFKIAAKPQMLAKKINMIKATTSHIMLFIKVQEYLIQSPNVLYTVLMNIDSLCRKAIKAMLVIEAEKKDVTYKTK